MGKIPTSHSHSQTPTPTPTFHSSHPHPLNPINLDNHHQTPPSSTCAGCKLRPSGMGFSCTPCNYFLHNKCFHMPTTITHPFHKDHVFTLLHLPAYPEGVFSCDACGHPGSGFSYHCKPCGIDLHVLCAEMPLSVTHACHVHKLHLTFELPYGRMKPYCCDICKNTGSSTHWLYRCDSCGFDAHLNCARGIPPLRPPPPQPHFFQAQSPMPQPTTPLFGPTPNLGFRPQFTPQAPNPNPSFINNNPAYGMPVNGPQAAMSQIAAANRQYEVALQGMIQQMIQNNQAMSQGLLAGGVGGFGAAGYGGGNTTEMQQLMQLISNFNNAGAGGGGIGFGGVGGGQEILQALMGGGGSGIGGGGLDFLQNLIGSGGGGLDLLNGVPGGLGGGFT